MALEVKQLNCPHCGASLSVKNARKAKVLVCESCGSQLDLTSPEYAVVGQAILGSALPASPIRLGQFATFDGVKWMVVGRVRYRDEEWWDEWLLMTEEGKYQWLVESDGDFSLYQPFAPTSPVDPNQVGDSVDLEGIEAKVTERGQATIAYLEGELTWKARIGDKMNYVEAEHDDGIYSIEWTENEIEFFRGQEIDQSEVYQAFGFDAGAPSIGTAAKAGGGAASGVVLIVAVIIIFVILCICCSVCGGVSGGGSDGGPSIRIGAPSGGGGSFGGGGGGFSGGK
jgi:hypothetical protein